MREYFCNRRTLIWGKDISPENFAAMATGEVFILNAADGLPSRYIMRDALGIIREHSYIALKILLDKLCIMAQIEAMLLEAAKGVPCER